MSTPTRERPVGALAERPFEPSALALRDADEAAVNIEPKSAPLRVGALLLLLAVDASSLFVATHELGDTAVYGRAYLWGESSSRVNCGTQICWFVDRLEPIQHTLLALALLTAVLALALRRVRVCVPLVVTAALLALAAVRAANGDGVALGYFWLAVCAVVCSAALALIARAR